MSTGTAAAEPTKRVRTTAVTAWESLFRAQVAVMRTLAAEFPTRDISFNEYDVLFTLSRRPDRSLRLRDLNKEVLLTQPSVSRLIDRLVARGLVAKCPEPSDARGTVIRLTDTGFEMFRRVAVDHMRSITERVGTRLDAQELETLAALCDKLRGGE
ncbi:MarR family winged helix-turn-helix transcriptional regulator [Leifsonia sp. TF02-11]|uniref:MarR family winged helix-turn-helix transcriptional regulator n=1 Tax=Leifsonia sp. TF02-11 TaxID=2815212 RepID=UPI001AA13FB8|nr:MarR family winged helix-turn-helix transcriptional regulator [Leifsonia sp. TF02-11]MBN9632604.1 winged helix-turn-helix transcriptional regulator [Actinomycetota bacterium]MBO1739752.1 winged helix-turn-helix transcriptional regulator [Leifsonia sp. TF02-11]